MGKCSEVKCLRRTTQANKLRICGFAAWGRYFEEKCVMHFLQTTETTFCKLLWFTVF
jgi:hypothetical protein